MGNGMRSYAGSARFEKLVRETIPGKAEARS